MQKIIEVCVLVNTVFALIFIMGAVVSFFAKKYGYKVMDDIKVVLKYFIATNAAFGVIFIIKCI